MPHYHVTRHGTSKSWALYRIDQHAHMGVFPQRKVAIQVARVLAGWQGKVTIGSMRIGLGPLPHPAAR